MTTENNVPAPEAKPAAPEGTAPEAPTADIVAAPAPEAVSFEKTGDPAADLALGYLAKAGVAAESLAMQMAKQGDFTLLRAEVAKKGAEGEAYVDVLEASHARKQADAQAARDRAEGVVQAVVGGKENWAAVKAFIASKADASELAEINASLRAGGVGAKATAEYLKRVYEAGTGINLDAKGGSPAPQPGPRGVPTGGRESVAPTHGALSPQEYRAEVQKLAREVGEGRVQHDPRYANLQARRRAYRG